MDAVKFFEERERMCDSFNGNCAGCEINKYLYGGMGCDAYVRHHPEEAVAIVEKWSKEHPRKTRQSEFLRMFPDAKIFKGTLAINPCMVVHSRLNTEECHMFDQEGNLGCYKCREKFWSEEVDDGHD